MQMQKVQSSHKEKRNALHKMNCVLPVYLCGSSSYIEMIWKKVEITIEWTVSAS